MVSIGNIDKKKPRGRPATGAVPVLVRLMPIDVVVVDRWIAKQGAGIGRPEAIRQMIRAMPAGKKKP
jgi:hypothetical protein